MPEITQLDLPLRVIITNSNTGVTSFVPYRENFIVPVTGGDVYNIQVQNSAEALYYEGQATTGFTVISQEIPDGVCPSVTFSESTGTFISSVTVLLDCTDTNAAIYYTTDGSDPTDESTEYDREGSGIEISLSQTLKAIAYEPLEYEEQSLITSITTTIKVATPVADPAGDDYTSNQSVELSCDTDGATIYYTTNGDTPTSESTEYTAAIDITGSSGDTITTVLKAIGIKSGVSSSDVLSETYNITLP